MTIPIYKIEVWQGGGLLHTFESEAINVAVNEVVTSGVGNFSFTLPTKWGVNYRYDDINVYDQVKIWMGYKSKGLTQLTTGKIYRISTPFNMDSGFIRVFVGKNQGEILQRRVKGRKAWVSTGASTIVTELANDLSLGTGSIGADATAVTMTVDKDTYYNVLRKLSDYWTGGGSLKKDFYVDTNNNLVWDDRPLRTAGVETLTVGDNIMAYNVTRSIEDLKNKIYMFGNKVPFNALDPSVLNRKNPSDGDGWTWVGTGWTATIGSVASNSTSPKIGSDFTRFTSNGSNEIEGNYTFGQTWVEGLEGYGAIELWHRHSQSLTTNHFTVRLWCDDSGNYYEEDFTYTVPNDTWEFFRKAIGPHNTYDADTNPDGEWVATGSPTWEDIKGIYFYAQAAAGFTLDVDGLCFNFGRWRDTAEDSTSQTNYGVRELVVVDNDLGSDSECQTRAEALVYQLKDPVIRLDVVTVGNTNIKVGDRLSMTIPAENISAANYDVVEARHNFTPKGFLTAVSMVNSANTRDLPVTNVAELMRYRNIGSRQVARGVLSVAK